MNQTGFSKILKKYNKVTGNKLKKFFTTTFVATSYPFLPSTKARLNEEIQKIVQGYAKITTDGDIDMSMHELDSHLREHIGIF